MLNKQQRSIAAGLYRVGLRVERITNGNTVTYDHDAQSEFLRRVQEEAAVCAVEETNMDEFSTLCGATFEGAIG